MSIQSKQEFLPSSAFVYIQGNPSPGGVLRGYGTLHRAVYDQATGDTVWTGNYHEIGDDVGLLYNSDPCARCPESESRNGYSLRRSLDCLFVLQRLTSPCTPGWACATPTAP